MTLNNLEFEKYFVKGTDKLMLITIVLSADVVILRAGVTYSVPLIQRTDISEDKYSEYDLELLLSGFLSYANKINENWKLVKEDLLDSRGGEVIAQKPFDITKDI